MTTPAGWVPPTYTSVPGRAWPVELSGRTTRGADIRLRPLRRRDQGEWQRVRSRSWPWLAPWEPTPIEPGQRGLSFGAYQRRQSADARAGRSLPFVIEVDGHIAGAMNMSNIVEGVFRSATMGYWVAPDDAGRGIAPAALALVADHAVATRRLHRVEVNIRPENEKSLAVARKLAFRDEGLRERFLHIDGAWRDHRSFALTVEDLGGQTFWERLHLGPAGPTPIQQ